MHETFIEVIAKALVDQPDKVTVTEKETADAVVLELHVAEGDMGKSNWKTGKDCKGDQNCCQGFG